MALDSLYGAWLKVHYPYEFYTVMLRLYSEKGNKEKVSLIIREMKAYRNISMIPGKFRQDNRDWYVDREHATISQSISSIKFIPASAAQALYKMKDMPFDYFADVLRYLQMNTQMNTRMIRILITLGYFSEFGGSAKLMKVFDAFTGGPCKVTKTLKSFEKRLTNLRKIEENADDHPMSVYEVLPVEQFVLEMCLTTDQTVKDGTYFVTNVEAKRSVFITAYSVYSGRTGVMKIRRETYDENPLQPGDFFAIGQWKNTPRYLFKDGKRKEIPGEKETWMYSWSIVHRSDISSLSGDKKTA